MGLSINSLSSLVDSGGVAGQAVGASLTGLNSLLGLMGSGLGSGGKYSSGQEKLAEKYFQYVKGVNTKSYKQMNATMTKEGIEAMPAIFGVPIYDIFRLNALGESVEAYYKFQENKNVPRADVERAVFLKKNYFPYSNPIVKWDLSVLSRQEVPAASPTVPQGGLGNLLGADLGAVAGQPKKANSLIVVVVLFLLGGAVFAFLMRKK